MTREGWVGGLLTKWMARCSSLGSTISHHGHNCQFVSCVVGCSLTCSWWWNGCVMPWHYSDTTFFFLHFFECIFLDPWCSQLKNGNFFLNRTLVWKSLPSQSFVELNLVVITSVGQTSFFSLDRLKYVGDSFSCIHLKWPH